MDIAVEKLAGTTRVRVCGAIDERGAEKLKAEFASLQLADQKEVLFDFAKVSHIGSAGLGKLLLFYKRLSSMGLIMRLDNTSPQLRQLLSELRLDTLFYIN